MTTTSPPKARPGLPPATTAQLVLGGLLLVHLAVVEVAFFAGGAGKNATLTVAKFFALHAASLMMLQLMLIARLPFLDRRLGMDRLTRWHRWVGFTLFWTVLTHAYDHRARLRPARQRAGARRRSWGWPAWSPSLLGMIAAAIIVVIAATSAQVPAPRGCPTRPGTPSTWPSTSRSSSRSSTRSLEGTTFASAVARRPTGGRCGRW